MPILAAFEATNKSHVKATSQPPARAKPLMAPIRGLLAPFRTNSFNGPISSPRAKAFKSIPAQKARPLPVITPAVRVSSASSSWIAFQRPFDRAPLMAFIASGRFRVMIMTRLRRSTRIACSSLICWVSVVRWFDVRNHILLEPCVKPLLVKRPDRMLRLVLNAESVRPNSRQAETRGLGIV